MTQSKGIRIYGAAWDGGPEWTNRFFAKIVPLETGCWLWVGNCRQDGYGKFGIGPDGFQDSSHRVAYELFIGPIPKGFQLDHLCRNRSCANPLHLEPVTPAENINRGRTRRVPDETAAQILALRPRGPKRAPKGHGLGAVAARFGTSPSTVSRIWRGGVTYV
jgi:hypothetical protein